MDIIGIICEYNPFHNGHIYHIKKIKEMYKDSIIIACISSSFLERGEVSIINKWYKTKMALDNNVDIVIELPFVYSSQSADIFAKGSVKLLNEMHCNKIVFGSELNDVETFKKIANLQKKSSFNDEVKKEMQKGINYPTAMSNVINQKLKIKVETPNDLLAISYIKEIINNNYKIEPISIKRTNDYHDKNNQTNIVSASQIRTYLKENKNIESYLPKEEIKLLYQKIDIFPLLKYKINIDNDLSVYQTVDEGIEQRLLKYINESLSLEEFISKIKTRRYTYNKINRMFIHILTSFTKEMAKKINISYIRILGFNKEGKKYLNTIKKDTNVPIITSYKNINNSILDFEYKVTIIYSQIVNDNKLIKRELEKPIIK